MKTQCSAKSHARPLVAPLHYFVSNGRKPRFYEDEPGIPSTDAAFMSYEMPILDARIAGPSLSFDRHGFHFVRHRSSVRNFDDEAEVKNTYYPEMAELIATSIGAQRVIVFDHNVRRRHPIGSGALGRTPAVHVHVDYTEGSAPKRARELLGAEAATWAASRYAFVNVWRPLVEPLRDAPLALADASSIGSRQLVTADVVYSDRTGEIYFLAHSESHRWFYLPDMRRDEVWIFKNFDSDRDCHSRFVPHAAFEQPGVGGDFKARESIEVRALVILAGP